MAEYEPRFYDGTLPGAAGQVGAIIGQVDIDVSKQRAVDLYQFFTDPNRNFLQLNLDNTPRPCIVGVPNSKKVRLLHCMGVGASALGTVSVLDDQLLFLTGDGGPDIGSPLPLVLPKSSIDMQRVFTMTPEIFYASMTTEGANYAWPLYPRARANEAQTFESVMQLAPIPSFLVLDGFTKDLDAAEIIERMDGLDDTDGDMYTHLRKFLMACLTGHNANDRCPRLQLDQILAPVSVQARIWAGKKFQDTYPTLRPRPPAAADAQPIQPEVAAILAQLLRNQQQAPVAQQQHQQAQVNPNDDDETVYNMSRQEFESTLIMCGLNPQAAKEELPAWYRLAAAKGMTEAFRSTVVRKHIMETFRYEDAEVPLTNQLLKMVTKRNWTGKEGNVNHPSLVTATEGLSPFLVMELTDDEVASINIDDDLLLDAKNVTASELKTARNKMKAKVPDTTDDLITLLKCYANLLFALFSEECPLFKCIEKTIIAIKAYSKNARNSFSMSTKASILWVVLKQSRKFAIGEMDVIQAFKAMHRKLAEGGASFLHAETPADLHITPKKAQEKRKPENEPKEAKKILKKNNNPNLYHPKVEAALKEALRIAKYPNFMTIMKYCETDPNDIFPGYTRKCTPNAVLGRCREGSNCTRSHAPLSDADVSRILEKLKKFIDNPSGVLQGQYKKIEK
jgi:hypothetical protein